MADQRWEYEIIDGVHAKIAELINEKAAEGWEVHTFTAQHMSSNDTGVKKMFMELTRCTALLRRAKT